MPILGHQVKYSALLIFIAKQPSEELWHLQSALLGIHPACRKWQIAWLLIHRAKKPQDVEGTGCHTLVQDDSESCDAGNLTQQSWQLPLLRHKLLDNIQPWPEWGKGASTSPGMFYGEEIGERGYYSSRHHHGQTAGEQRAVMTADKHDY